MTLLQRIETALEPRRELFEEARKLIGTKLYDQYDWRLYLQGRKWEATLTAEAWTSAAEMLLPDGWRVDHMRDHLVPKPHCNVALICWNEVVSASAAVRSLALLTAILRAALGEKQ